MKDISAWRLVENFVGSRYNDAVLVDGLQATLQRFMLIFLTEPGSARYSFGRTVEPACPFMSAWRHGDIRSEATIRTQFELCQSYIQQAMRSQQYANDPPECKFKSAILEKITIQPGSVYLSVIIDTEGGTLPCVLPLPV